VTDALDRLTAALADRYLIERELGAGGMATVYLAEDAKHHREVAVKVLRPDLAASLGPERFLREVTIAANLQHPHILPVYDSGEADGVLYYVMPYVEGDSLRDRLTKHGELPLTDAVRILRDVADAMAAAHAKGVVHRDIKPENIMLSGRHALVADFGVAKAVSEATGRQTLTTAGVALGTPTYMAPEQAAADPHTDHRADLYAFGVTAYEMLTGQPPFVGATPQAVLAAHVTEAPVSVMQRRATIPPALAQLIMRCLEKKPADRPQSAEELLPVLEGLTTPSGGMTPTQTIPARIAHRGGRATLIRVGGAVGVLAAVVLGWWLLDGRGATTTGSGNGSIPIAVLTFETRDTGDDTEAFSEGLAEDVATQLAKIKGFAVKAPASARRVSVDTMSYPQIAALLGVEYLVHGTWDRAGDDLRVTARLIAPETEEQVWADDYTRGWGAANIFDLRSDVARQVAAALDLQLTPEEQAQLAAQPTANTEAYKAYQLGRFFWNKRTDEGLRRSIEYFNDAIAADSGFALAYAGLADAHVALPWYANAPPLEAFPAAEAAALHALVIDSTLGEAYASLGLVRQNLHRDLPASEAAFRRAVKLSPSYATAHQWYGLHLLWIGRIDEGLAEIRRALELDPVSLIINANLVEGLLAADRVDEAIEQYHRARTLNPGWSGGGLLGWSYVADGRLDDALTFFDSRDHILGQMHVYARMGDRARALQLYAEHEQRLRRDSHQQWVSVFPSASAALAVGDTNRAFALLARAVEDRDPRINDVILRNEPWKGLWRDRRFRSLMNSAGFAVVGGMVVPLNVEPEG
jgi:serine/threonine-protein kinase